MAISRTNVRTRAKQLAQNDAVLSLLISDPGDYNEAITQALRVFEKDRPNVRVVDQAIATAGFRFNLTGVSALSGLTADDAFLTVSQLLAVYLPWVLTNQNQEPMDANDWRVVRDPGGILVLELLRTSAGTSDTLRLVFTSRHTLNDAENTVAPPAAPTVTLISPAAPGNVDNGLHKVRATYLTATGETELGAEASITVVDKSVNGKLTVVVAASGQDGITGTRVFMTITGGAGNAKLVAANATDGGTFTINTADADLGADGPTANTAGGGNTVDDYDEDMLAMLAASFILELAAVKAVQNTGNSSLPNDIVDRRTQSDMFRSRSKELRDMYATQIGSGPVADVRPASAVKDMDLDTSHGWGYLSRGKRLQ